MANLGTMFLLRGGPRAGQLVDDLPPGYGLLAEHTNGPSQFLVGDIVAAVAVWSEPGGMPPLDAER